MQLPAAGGWESIFMQGQKVGPYLIVRQLGSGGMGTVYEAVHPVIERRVALKVLHPQLARDLGVMKRFANEARAVNLIDHPGLVQISDFGQEPDGTAYIVMELLRGRTLARQVKAQGGRLQLAEALQVGAQIAAALQAAHDKKVIHRDLKPENVMMVPDARSLLGTRVKILDFGIAKIAEESQREQIQTRSGTLLGTPRYMSPEQCRAADKVTDRTDVYALGIMLFELLAGRAPFTGQSAFDVLAKHIYEPAPLLSEVCPGLPQDLCQLVGSLLAKLPAQRPAMATVHAALDELSRVHAELADLPTQRHKEGARPSRPSVPRASASMSCMKGEKVGPMRRRPLVACAVGVLSGGALLGWGTMLKREPGPLPATYSLAAAQPESVVPASAPAAPASAPAAPASTTAVPASASAVPAAPRVPTVILTPPRPVLPAILRRERAPLPRPARPAREFIPY